MNEPREKKSLPAFAAAFLQNDYAACLKRYGYTFDTNPLDAEFSAWVVNLLYENHIDRKAARTIIDTAMEKNAELRDTLKWVGEGLATGVLPTYTGVGA